MELKLEDITFSYRKGSKALIDVTAAFGEGIHLLLGPNGAGKSTLMNIIAGRLRPQHGECVVGKEATAFHSPHTLKELFLLSSDSRFPMSTINDMARLHAPFYPNFSRDFLGDALWAFKMSGNEKLREMSLGNRHKAQVAYALALGTGILLLDEPANGLDITSQKTLTSILGHAMDAIPGRCIIVATHTVHEMRNLFDTVTVLNHGSVILNSSLQTITERLAFICDPARRDDALCFEAKLEGPTQIVPSDGTLETAPDFTLLYMAAVGPYATQLQTILK